MPPPAARDASAPANERLQELSDILGGAGKGARASAAPCRGSVHATTSCARFGAEPGRHGVGGSWLACAWWPCFEPRRVGEVEHIGLHRARQSPAKQKEVQGVHKKRTLNAHKSPRVVFGVAVSALDMAVRTTDYALLGLPDGPRWKISVRPPLPVSTKPRPSHTTPTPLLFSLFFSSRSGKGGKQKARPRVSGCLCENKIRPVFAVDRGENTSQVRAIRFWFGV